MYVSYVIGSIFPDGVHQLGAVPLVPPAADNGSDVCDDHERSHLGPGWHRDTDWAVGGPQSRPAAAGVSGCLLSSWWSSEFIDLPASHSIAGVIDGVV